MFTKEISLRIKIIWKDVNISAEEFYTEQKSISLDIN